MKKIIFGTISVIFFALFTSGAVFAQGMPAPYRREASGAGMGNNMMGGNNAITQSNDGHTAREGAEGKEIWKKFQAEELKCENLTDDNFGVLGEYFMGQMAGEQHEAMNNMMIQMMGEKGEKQMHVAMGKRMSGCEPNAPMPQNMMDGGMMPMMMNMMTGGSMMGGGGNSMMGNFAINPTGWFNWSFSLIFMILFWGFIILGIIALIKWIMYSSEHMVKSKSALDILKERYAKGEIDKKEFEEKKKDLS